MWLLLPLPPQTEVLNEFFSLVFTIRQDSHASGVPEILSGGQGNKIPTSVSVEQVRDHLMRLKVYKSTGSDEIQLTVLKELADVVAKLPSITSEKLWLSGKDLSDWKNGNTMFKKGRKEVPRNCRPVSLTSGPGKITEWILLEEMLGHI